ncbi:MAG: MoaD/ThiS family protein [Candidatus Dormibacteria bacterium]
MAPISPTSVEDPPVRVLLFGELGQRLGKHRELATTAPCTVADIWRLIVEPCPDLADHHHSIRPAVNETLAAWEDDVAAGDRVAFLPPVSGG